MQQGIHPAYGPVAFRDRATGTIRIIGSTLVDRPTGVTVEVEGTRYLVVDVDISSTSHPFWTGTARTLDSEGRVEKFERRYGRRS